MYGSGGRHRGLGSELADLLLVDTGDAEMQSILQLDLDGIGVLKLNGMREAQGQGQLAALLGGTIADALNFQILAEALGNTDDHVMDQGAGQAMEAACLLLVIGAGNQNLIALDSNSHQRMKFGMQGTLGALTVIACSAASTSLPHRRE